jgi:AcrR family transcriptional regulator
MATNAEPSQLGRRERRKREVHQRMVDAAAALFDRQGVAATTVDEICERADVAQKTFFNHFPTRQHLVRELAEGIVDALHALLEEARKQPLPTRQKLDYFFDRVAHESKRFVRVRRELVVEVIRVCVGDPEQTRKLHASFGAILRDGVAAGEVGDAHGVEFLTETTVGIFSGIILDWVSLEGYPLRERLAEAAEFLGAAIGPKTDRAPKVSEPSDNTEEEEPHESSTR